MEKLLKECLPKRPKDLCWRGKRINIKVKLKAEIDIWNVKKIKAN
jgi:hypothetical protein